MKYLIVMHWFSDVMLQGWEGLAAAGAVLAAVHARQQQQ